MRRKREERLGKEKVVGIGEGSYIQGWRHLGSVLLGIPHWGNVETDEAKTKHQLVPWDGKVGGGMAIGGGRKCK